MIVLRLPLLEGQLLTTATQSWSLHEHAATFGGGGGRAGRDCF